jgi:hypothetical protein
MARKTTGNVTPRSKKNTTPAQPAAEQIAAPVSKTEVLRTEFPKKGYMGATATVAPPANLEEEIRRRAYELYLERRATAGSLSSGNESQDWLVAEREILTRHGQDHHA